ncbi:Glycosyltransferase involved in cell wall bisynthesis [Sphingomonas jatrophae]|uniref:Glycosyltransferase involved in cell wall bisynthesis n=2 Tax=Sphingomonas jatrophae TaxID=1166337 RepID=A0A1I6KZ92_9SPHN|nr:Glycosyltransferase involved in cell wall bisynthesis [Sphingomonas jatrophae]
MPRLCILVHDLSATGVVRNALALSKHLARTMDVELVTIRGGGVLAGEVDPAVATVSLSGNMIGRVLRLRRRLRNADVLLSAGNRGHLFAWLASARLARLRRVYRLSNSFAHERAGNALRQRLRSVGRWLTLSLIGRQADQLIANSPSLARELRQRLAGPARLAVIPNGVDVATVRRRAGEPCAAINRKAPGVPLVLAVGRLVEQKNHETLVDALAVANRTRPVDLAILGAGTAEARRRLERRAAAVGIADRLYLLPPTSNPFAIMRQASLFAMPSWWEGSSNALLEAIACGLPVVASDRAGSAHEVLGFGRHGLLVDPRDAEGMGAAMLVQLSDEAVLPGEQASRYDSAVMLARYEALIRRVIADPVAVQPRPRIRLPEAALTPPV